MHRSRKKDHLLSEMSNFACDKKSQMLIVWDL